MLERFDINDYKTTIISINIDIKLKFDEKQQATIAKIKNYQTIISNLIYLSSQTRCYGRSDDSGSHAGSHASDASATHRAGLASRVFSERTAPDLFLS